MEINQMLKEMQTALEDKKGRDILVLDVRGKTSVCDYFIIASGSSSSQVRALSESIEERLGKLGVEKKRREGFTDGRWVVLDYGDVVVHIFQDEMRLFYHLETLWKE
ncbi:MAG: ribosome silencing factor [Clostridia bacterium]|nr:ribosome silencing factor [Clostridia bacterium]